MNHTSIEPYKYKKKKKNSVKKYSLQNTKCVYFICFFNITLLIAVSIYFYIMKYRAKRNKIIIISQHK